MIKKIKKTISIIFVFAFSIVYTLSFLLFWRDNNFNPDSQFVYINKGDSFNSITEKLFDGSIIYSKQLFNWAGVILNYDKKIKTGKYEIKSGMSNLELLKTISDFKNSVTSKVTIYEGLNNRRLAHLLKKEISIDSVKFISETKNLKYLKIYDKNVKSLEGFLLPDTYNFEWQEDESFIVKNLVEEFNKFFVDSLQRRMKQINLSLNEVVTMASLVEGETKISEERSIVAGVYYNRLKKRMRLEADPTIQYLVNNGPRRLFFSDLKIESEYNTFINYGLPPGPINNPSRESIIAALYPAKHNLLFFVANGKGGHTFASNYEEHKKNVAVYRKIISELRK